MPGNLNHSDRPIWLAIIVLAAVIVGAASGFVLHLAHADPAAALVGSGAAFAAAMTIGMAASRFLACSPRNALGRTPERTHPR
jgi:hypothetical protein